MTDDRPNLELILAQQADDAMRRGADPKATTERLGVMLKHLRANPDVAQHGADALAQGADHGAVTGRVWQLAQSAPAPKRPLAARIGEFVAEAASAPVRSAFNATVAPSVGAARPDPRLSKGGNPSGAPIDRAPYDAEHGGITGKQRRNAVLQTGANIVAPALARLPGGIELGGALVGASYDTENRLRGIIMGGGGAGILHAAPKVGGAVLDATGSRPTSYAGTPSLPVAAADAAERVVPTLATRNINNPPPVNVGSRLLKSTARVVGVESAEQRAVRKVLEAVQRDGLDLEAAVQKVSAQTKVKPETLMDLAGQNVMKLTRGAAMVPNSKAADQIPTALQNRALGQEERVLQDLLGETKLGGRTNTFERADELIQQRRANAKPLYEKAYEAPPIDDPDVLALFKDDAFDDAYQTARRIAKREGVDLPESLTRDVEVGGAKISEQVPVSVQAFDYVKRGLDDVIEKRMKSGTIGRTEARQLRNMLDDAIEKVDAGNPDYAKARSQFAGDTRMMEALDQGRTIFKIHPDEAQRVLSKMSEGERELFRRGALESFADKVESVGSGNDVTRRVFDKTLDKKRLRLLFPDDASFDAFGQQVAREARMNQSRNFIKGQSATADKLAELADVMGFSLDDIANLAQGNVSTLATKLVSKGMRARAQGLTQAVADQVARRTTAGASSRTPDELRAVLQELLAARGKQGPRQVRRALKGSVGGIGAGQANQP